MSVSIRAVPHRHSQVEPDRGQVAPSKVTPPGTEACLERPRLLEALRDRTCTLLWIGGFPGSGKTTLAAQMFYHHTAPAIWLRVDVTDDDPAAFFKHLSGAAAAAGLSNEELPNLSPDRFGALGVFAREFLRAMFFACEEDCLIVLDDVHLLDPQGVVAGLLPVLVDETPPGSRFVVTSREQPPDSLARAITNRTVHVLPDQDLQLTQEEAAQLAQLRRLSLDEADIKALHRRTSGWVGALALLDASSDTSQYLAPTAPLVGQYFASQALAHLNGQQRSDLSKLAWLPQIDSELAQSLTGTTTTFPLLADMANRGLFVTSHDTGSATLRLHDLLAEHLRQFAREQLTEAEISTVLHKSADALELSDEIDSALDVLMQCHSFDKATSIIERNASAAFREARLRTLKGWTQAIPQGHRDKHPWLLYWSAMCLLMEDPAAGRDQMVRAYRAFQASDDLHGRFLALSYMIGSYFMSYSSAHPLREWVDEVGGLSGQFESMQDVNVQASAALGVWYGLFLVEPDHPDLPLWESRLQELIRQPISATVKLRIGMMLSKHYYYTGQFRKIWPLRALLLPETLDPSVSPYGTLVWFLFSLPDCWSRGDFGEARLELDRALAVSEKTGIHLLDNHIIIHAATSCLLDDALEEAETLLARVPLTSHSTRHMEVWHLYLGKAWHACQAGRHVEAREYASVCLQAGKDMGGIAPQCFALAALAYSAIGCGTDEDACEHLANLNALVQRTGNQLATFHAELIEASLALRDEDHDRCTAILHDAFARGRELALFHFQWAIPSILAPLCQHALEHGIEHDYVAQLIAERRLNAFSAPEHLEAWPWPVKIYTLGVFRVLVDGEPLSTTSKAQTRTLSLLKAIVAFGASQVSAVVLCDALWPDADGDAARHSLETALYRLRKLIGKESVQVHDGKVSLNPHRCWIDVRAFENLLADDARKHRAQALYQGPFLADEPDPSWAIGPRERYATLSERLS